jgi:ferrous iron transport protein B
MTTIETQVPMIALVGSPNAGKSVLFNTLTGLHQKVGNYPGVTVERKSGRSKPWNGKTFEFLDLPGTYSLDPISIDEQVAVDTLLGRLKSENEPSPSAVVAVIDATNLERSLGLVLELKELGLPLIVALNMMDLAQKRGLKLNVRKLSELLVAPVVPMIATRGDGIAALMTQIEKTAVTTSQANRPNAIAARDLILPTHTQESISKRFRDVDALLLECVEVPTSRDLLTWNIDRVVLHPLIGPLLLIAVLSIMFQAIFSWASPLADGIESLIALLSDTLKQTLPAGAVLELLTDGILAGVGGVLVFLPQITILFFFINLLEASGYMTRAAFLLDRIMHAVGLQGRSFVPLLSSFACAIPGVMATRSIRNDRDRLLTIMVAPLMTCSARLPVYTLLIAAFVPSYAVFGLFNSQALAMLALFMIGIASAFVVALVSRIVGGRRQASPFMLEMPTYRMPHWRYIAMSVWLRILAFLQRAGTIILASSVAIWVLSTYPKPPADFDKPAIEYSLAGRLGRSLEPLVAPIGFDWRIATSLIPGLAAREVMVSSLATVFAIEAAGDEEAQAKSLTERIQSVWAPATGFALIAWYIFAPQCLSTLATVRRETGQWKWTLVMTLYMFALAWVAAFIAFRVFS